MVRNRIFKLSGKVHIHPAPVCIGGKAIYLNISSQSSLAVENEAVMNSRHEKKDLSLQQLIGRK